MSTLRVTLIKSVIGQQWRARRVVAGMGFTKINQTRTLPDNDAIRGMIRRVKHLVVFEPVDDSAAVGSAAPETSE